MSHLPKKDVELLRSLGRTIPMALTNDGALRIASCDESRDRTGIASVDCQTEFKRGRGHEQACEERDANALLIASAPELLEALRELVAHQEYLLACGESQINPLTLQRAADAIEKATTLTPPEKQG
jgi:1,6-anhydro-N-acetylmuramate kinase